MRRDHEAGSSCRGPVTDDHIVDIRWPEPSVFALSVEMPRYERCDERAVITTFRAQLLARCDRRSGHEGDHSFRLAG